MIAEISVNEVKQNNFVIPTHSQCPVQGKPLALSFTHSQAERSVGTQHHPSHSRGALLAADVFPPLLHAKPDLPYTSLIQTSRANINVLLALYHAACLYNNWSQLAHAAHTCWCLHVPCKKLATTDKIQKPNLAQLTEPPSFPQTHLPTR